MEKLADRINLILQTKSWSAAELARQAKVSRAAVTDWRNGNVASLTAEVAARIAEATGYSMLWVAKGDGPRDQAADAKAGGDWPFRLAKLSDLDRLTLEEQRDLDKAVARLIAGCISLRK